MSNLYVRGRTLIKVIQITKTKITSEPKEIFPMFIKPITNKLCKVICFNGNKYYVMSEFVTEEPFGYVGKSFAEFPKIGSSFMFKSVIPFIWDYEKTRWCTKWVHIHKVYSIKEIGENFLEITGITKHRTGHNIIITAYVSLQ